MSWWGLWLRKINCSFLGDLVAGYVKRCFILDNNHSEYGGFAFSFLVYISLGRKEGERRGFGVCAGFVRFESAGYPLMFFNASFWKGFFLFVREEGIDELIVVKLVEEARCICWGRVVIKSGEGRGDVLYIADREDLKVVDITDEALLLWWMFVNFDLLFWVSVYSNGSCW
jgi:hypothetical protein